MDARGRLGTPTSAVPAYGTCGRGSNDLQLLSLPSFRRDLSHSFSSHLPPWVKTPIGGGGRRVGLGGGGCGRVIVCPDWKSRAGKNEQG